MKREGTLEEISDGRLYGLNDMVRADCHDCEGCSACCRGMGCSIVLTPYDIYLLTTNLKCTFEELLKERVELNVAEGIILPNLKMAGQEEKCAFLNEAGRCSIHPFRPGICRLFPLGRYYEGEGFKYFLQTHECRKENRSKVKVEKWLDTPDIQRNEEFILRWHELLKNFQEYIRQNPDYEQAKRRNIRLLQTFFFAPYKAGDFYEQAKKRFEDLEGKKDVG